MISIFQVTSLYQLLLFFAAIYMATGPAGGFFGPPLEPLRKNPRHSLTLAVGPPVL